MGKRKSLPDTELEEDVDVETDSPTKHKKAKKHKKHKKKKSHSISDDLDVLELDASPKPSIKLKIKLGGQTFTTKSIDSSAIASSESIQSVTEDEPKALKKAGDDTSDEEKEWLDALEKGNLDDYGGIKKNKDPKLLTARQRALLHGPSDELLELPSGYKKVELTEEQLQRRKQRASKRREQAHEKREKAKKQTVDRLLKKQEAKLKGAKAKGPKSLGVPHVRYLQTQTSVSLSLPGSQTFPLPSQTKKEPPLPVKCTICRSNYRKYSCSKTGKPLCSLLCYKKNKELNPKAFEIST